MSDTALASGSSETPSAMDVAPTADAIESVFGPEYERIHNMKARLSCRLPQGQHRPSTPVEKPPEGI